MKSIVKITSIVCSVLLVGYYSSFAQESKFLEGTESYRNAISSHLSDIQYKSKDSSYRALVIPKNGIPQQANQKTTTINTHFPYPVIMIHGLVSNSDTWLALYAQVLNQGWTYGGRMDFCLNSDADNAVASLTTDITDYTSGLTNADFYLVNFDVNPDGTTFLNSVLSNQAAIYKQGIAVKKAIEHVLTVTGKEKVVVLVHSMGGLATRQYLQNSSLWQADGQHHIAKLATLGTPHGGSNMDGTFLLNWLMPPDVQSDAVRDLRRSYFWSGDPGVFLHGGLEDNDVMYDALFSDFYNTDVNCNGVSGDNILGLDQKPISTNLDYTCLYGDYWLAPTTGDGIVSAYDAQLKNFYPTLSAETFTSTGNHVELPGEINEEYLCIDEPDEFALGYYINKDTLYNGFITIQADDCPYINDYDQYHFNVQQAGNVEVRLGNLQVTPFRVKLLDGSFNTVLTETITTLTGTTTPIVVTSGKYYMQLSALPTSTSWQYPYNYKVSFSAAVTTGITQELPSVNQIMIYPNPVNDELHITLENPKNELVEIKITDVLGQTLYETTPSVITNEVIRFSEQTNGIYFVTIKTAQTNYTYKFLKNN